MTNVAALISDMVLAGVDPMLIGRVAAALAEREPVPVKIVDEQAERRRAADRERKARRIPQNSTETAEIPQTVSPLSPPPFSSPKPLTKTPPIIPPSGETLASANDDFDAFWRAYPHKVGKPKAKLAYVAASRRAKPPDIAAGLERAKAQWRDPQFIPHPTTWLNRDGWADELPEIKPQILSRQPNERPYTTAAERNEAGTIAAFGRVFGKSADGDPQPIDADGGFRRQSGLPR